jgi:hypothetical protein
MSRGFKVPINLVGLTTDPSTASAGDIYFNVTSSKIRYYTSTGWQDVGSGTGGGGTLNHTHDYNGNPIAGVGSLVGTTSFGAGVPNNDNGFENDLYIDITNLDIYKKGPSIWAAPTEINVYTKGEISSLLANKQDKISGVSDTEIGYLDGVTSAIQTQLDSKLSTANLAEAAQDAVAGAIVAGTGITRAYDDAGNTITIGVDTTAIQTRVTNVSNTEIGYLDGVTSGIQSQIDSKATTLNPSFIITDTTTETAITYDYFLSNGTSITILGFPSNNYPNNYFMGDKIRIQHAAGSYGSPYYGINGLYTISSHYSQSSNIEVFYIQGPTYPITINEAIGYGGPTSIVIETALQKFISSTEVGYLDGVTSGIQTQLNTKSPLASPTFTGTPSAPTAAANTNTTQLATTAFVGTAVGSVSQALTNFQSSSTNTFVSVALLGVADGVATLDSTGNVPYSQLGNIGNAFASTSALSDVEALALAGL